MILNKARFSTKFGILYYLWMDSEKGQKIVSISTSSGSLEDYIEKISTSRKNLNNISVNEKKLPILERKISSYLQGNLKDIGLEPAFLIGSEFEKKVWMTALKIPFGKTASYREIAEICGRPQTYRAVGNALGKNPIMIIVPCHRVINSNGEIGGFSAGPGLKRKLLKIEGIDLQW